MNLKNKVAMITGASQGIGKAIAAELAKKGAHIALVSRSEDTLNAVKEQLPGENHLVVVADFSKPGQAEYAVNKVVNHYHRIDVLVNNAGSWELAPFIKEFKSGSFEKRMQLNFHAPAEAMAYALAKMGKQQEGMIINISSMAAVRMYPSQAGYVSSKIALNGLSASVAKEYEDKGIYVFSLALGSIDTPMYRKTVKYDSMDPEEKAKFDKEIKTTKDVADLVGDLIESPQGKEPIVELLSYEFKG